MAGPTSDKWAGWLLSRRDGDDEELRRRHAAALDEYRDGVLDRAGITPGDVVLDVGTGTGLIGFGALGRVGPDGRVIFSDVSADLLAECRRRAGDDPRCAFVQASADDLRGIADASVDVVTSRSVLMYLPDKRAGFAEIARVLRPGGRLSIFEPINSFAAARGPDHLLGLDLSPVADLVVKVLAAYGAAERITDFDERDLLTWAAGTGFTAVEMDYRAQLDVPMGGPPPDWAALKHTAPNPLVPTYAEAMAATLTAAERDRLDRAIRELVDAGVPRRVTIATAFLRAVRAGPAGGPRTP
jgi:arsenite methyltransferase